MLHEGSALALICDLMDEMDQRGADVHRFRDALESGIFDQLPLAKQALRVGLKGTRDLQEAAVPVYREYVLGYLSTLVG